jgi:CheY-like chemotaxis protein
MAKILIVEDDVDFHEDYKNRLSAEDGHELLFAVSSETAITALTNNPDTDLIILDHVLEYGIPCVEFVSFLYGVWQNQRQQKTAKKPLLVTASSVAFNVVGAEKVFKKSDLLDNLHGGQADHEINRVLRENGLVPTSPANTASGNTLVPKNDKS